jgi:Family of unknown function (DUF6365)
MTGGVAFLIDIVDSYGERELAMRFAARLARPAETVLVVKSALEPYLRGRFAVRSYDAPDAAAMLLRDLDPRLLVCVEYFNLPDALQAHVAAGPWRLATTDGTGMGLAINTNPFQTPVPMRKISLPEGLALLRSCPVSDPRPDTDLVFHWAMWPGLSRGDRAEVRRAWSIEADRVAMMTISSWSLGAAPYPQQDGHYRILFERIIEALQGAGGTVELMVVTRMRRPRIQIGRVAVRFVDFMGALEFERLLLGCDLFIADSVIQMSAAKAFTAGVPTLVLTNSRPENGPVYDIFPLALPFPRGDYYAALAPVELGDRETIRARVAAALAGDDPPRGGEYRAALDRLRSPAEIASMLS